MRELITTWFEVAGLVVIAAGAALEVATYSVAGGVATGGALLLASSALLTLRPRTVVKPKGEPLL